MASFVKTSVTAIAFCVAGVSGRFIGQDACPTALKPSYAAPVVASGWTAQLVANGLTSPRGIKFDSSGALLVVEEGKGVTRLAFNDLGGSCLNVSAKTTVVSNTNLNHGIALSVDGKTLYASSEEAAYAWPYTAASGAVGTRSTIVTNMSNADHVSRTLMISTRQPTKLLVARGSNDNMDLGTRDIASGRSMIKVFDLTQIPSSRPYEFSRDGRVLGWGLRNDVGVAEEPLTGGIYSVENSADNVARNGVDVHTDNPGEELNFLGSLADPVPAQPPNYGYPDCFTLWNTNVPNAGNLKTGSQFALNQTSTLNDTTCATQKVAPRLTFAAHMAPLDILFKPDGSAAYITFHGSWNRDPPSGYKLSQVAFANGQPTAPSTSTTALIDIMTNPDLTACPNGCFRPVGLAMDTKGRLFMSSDATGEIWVLQQTA